MVCDIKCRSCMYASTLSNMSVVCNYLLITGNRRGCPAGKGCERYIKGDHAISIDNSIRKAKPKPKNKVDQREKKRKYRERTQAMWQGRQHDAIQAWCQENKVSYTKLARMLGVSETTVAYYWAKEYSPARWDKLAKVGIRKPELP
ncbi:MAG: AsnC family protein [Clostridia bacterium]|nr:AsnC family protein [Clostridia bacterium]